MNLRVVVGGLVGGVVLFVWGSLSHVVLPLGEVGIQSLPSEEPVIEAMRAHITAPGLYFIPGIAPGQHNDEAAMKAWEEKAKRGPVAVLVYQLKSEGAMSPTQLGTEFGSNLLVGLLVALVLANLDGSVAKRAGLAAVMGLAASMDTFASYWNWYKFPTDYTLAQTAIQVIGFLLMGAAAAAIIKKQ